MIYSAIAPGMALPPTSLWSCEKAEFGQISPSFSLNSGAIRLKRPKNLTQIGFPSLRPVKPDRLLACGINSCAHWLNWKCGMSMGSAREWVRVARVLPESSMTNLVVTAT
jgi:hypothetical protein